MGNAYGLLLSLLLGMACLQTGCRADRGETTQGPPDDAAVAVVAALEEPGALPPAAASAPAAAPAAESTRSGAAGAVAASPTPADDGGTVAAQPDAARRQAPEDTPDDEDEEDKDYWEGVQFGPEHFDEVLQFVREHYIDHDIDTSRAYAEACVYVMGGMEHAYQVLPRRFYEQRKGHPDEEGALDGKSMPLEPGLPVVLVEVVDKEPKKKRKRLSDEEIRERRKKAEARRDLLEKEWAKIRFTREHFEHCLAKAREFARNDPDQPKDDLERDLWLAAAQGFLHALDAHSSVVSAKAWEESTRRTTDSSFEGIGAILTKRDEFVVVESPIEGQPAFRAGLRAGDIIIKVDDKNVVGWELHAVVKRIRGPSGTTVVLTVRREGEPEDIEIPIVRSYIKIQNVTAKLIKQHRDLGHIKLSGFVPTSAARLREAIEDLARKTAGGKLRGLVLDLRNNSGGLLQQAVEIADMFLDSGDIVSVRDRQRPGDQGKVYRARPPGTYHMPLVVLVNDGSASASEIVAGAIQDNARGLIVGERTFGKASVQTLFNPRLGSGYYIKLTVARYYTPAGRTIQVIGISPDLEVPREIGKPMPVGFREENLSHHLGAIVTEYTSPNAELARKVEACAKRRGIAEQIHQADPNPQIRFDYQLMKAADYLECLADLDAQARTSKARQAPRRGRRPMTPPETTNATLQELLGMVRALADRVERLEAAVQALRQDVRRLGAPDGEARASAPAAATPVPAAQPPAVVSTAGPVTPLEQVELDANGNPIPGPWRTVEEILVEVFRAATCPDEDLAFQHYRRLMHAEMVRAPQALTNLRVFQWKQLRRRFGDYLSDPNDPRSFTIVRKHPPEPTDDDPVVKVFVRSEGRQAVPTVFRRDPSVGGAWRIETSSL